MLTICGADKRFGRVHALRKLDLCAAPGRVLGLLGPNGSGKTTAMRAIFDLVRLDSGSVSWRGKPVGRRQVLRFGYMPEQRGLYPKVAVGEQLRYFARLRGLSRDAADSSIARWLGRLDLADHAGRRLEALSNGNQQRVQLAAAFLHDPDLVVLDEPFTGLDPIAVETLGQLVRERALDGMTVIFSSHQLDLVQDLVDDVAIIDHGSVLAAGPVGAIRTASAYRRLDVELASAASSWWRRLPGAELRSLNGTAVRLRVTADLDLHLALQSARLAGPVVSFSYTPPSLSEVFLETVRECAD